MISILYRINRQANSQRQGSQGSLFEQFTSHAKELVKETTRQSSQDGLLAHVDKVNLTDNSLCIVYVFVFEAEKICTFICCGVL